MADVMITLFNHETQTKQRSYFFVCFVVEKKRPIRFIECLSQFSNTL